MYILNTDKSTCTSGSYIEQDSNTYKISLRITGSDTCNLYYDLEYPYEKGTLARAIIEQANVLANPDFYIIATDDEGVFAIEDDYGISYYFRGAVENNYIIFGEYTTDIYYGYASWTDAYYKSYTSLDDCESDSTYKYNCELAISSGTNMYWRIMRVNGDGSIRLIYDGTEAHINGDASIDRQISTTIYNPSRDYNAYIGYMYGTPNSSTYEEEHKNTNSSTIKTVVDTWYKNNFLGTEYESYLADEIFCNDRSIASGLGYGQEETYYNTRNRTYIKMTPQLICNQKNDAFTVSDTTYGNGDLTYPIGLITADEILLAGGVYSLENTSYYLYMGNNFWTISPLGYYDLSARIRNVDTLGAVGNRAADYNFGVRPVINLKADVLISSGDGTYSNPFELTLS